MQSCPTHAPARPLRTQCQASPRCDLAAGRVRGNGLNPLTLPQLQGCYGLLNSTPSSCSTRPLVAPPALACIALGSQGIRVGPADWPTPSSSEHRKLLRDGLRLTLWRACSPGCCPQTGRLWCVGALPTRLAELNAKLSAISSSSATNSSPATQHPTCPRCDFPAG